MIALAKKVGGGRPAWMIVPAFFVAGAALVHLLINARWDLGTMSNLFVVFSVVYTKVGWVSIPLAIAALALVWATVKSVTAMRHGIRVTERAIQVLERVASLAPKLGLLGTVTGMVTAMTMNYVGLSEVEAQMLKMNAFGTALYSTMAGVILSIIAELQIPDEKEAA